MASAKKSSAAYGTKSYQGGGSTPPSEPPPPPILRSNAWLAWGGQPPPIEQAPTPPLLNKLLHVGQPPPPEVPTAKLFFYVNAKFCNDFPKNGSTALKDCVFLQPFTRGGDFAAGLFRCGIFRISNSCEITSKRGY